MKVGDLPQLPNAVSVRLNQCLGFPQLHQLKAGLVGQVAVPGAEVAQHLLRNALQRSVEEGANGVPKERRKGQNTNRGDTRADVHGASERAGHDCLRRHKHNRQDEASWGGVEGCRRDGGCTGVLEEGDAAVTHLLQSLQVDVLQRRTHEGVGAGAQRKVAHGDAPGGGDELSVVHRFLSPVVGHDEGVRAVEGGVDKDSRSGERGDIVRLCLEQLGAIQAHLHKVRRLH